MENVTVPVPCGKCPECRKRRISGWSFRLQQEEKISTSAHFITITYDTVHVPITDAGYMSAKKEDVQKFMKRLRFRVHTRFLNNEYKLMVDEPIIKYYLVSEYGGRTTRPHYHAIIFNVPDPYDIEETWQRGHIRFDPVTPASIGYCLKYMDKPRLIPMHKNDDREPEFSLMSKGLGANYINDQTKAYHLADLQNRACLTIEDGKKIPMPRYYKTKIYHETQVQAIGDHIQKTHDKILNEKLLRNPDYFQKMRVAETGRFTKFKNNIKKDKL